MEPHARPVTSLIATASGSIKSRLQATDRTWSHLHYLHTYPDAFAVGPVRCVRSRREEG